MLELLLILKRAYPSLTPAEKEALDGKIADETPIETSLRTGRNARAISKNLSLATKKIRSAR